MYFYLRSRCHSVNEPSLQNNWGVPGARKWKWTDETALKSEQENEKDEEDDDLRKALFQPVFDWTRSGAVVNKVNVGDILEPTAGYIRWHVRYFHLEVIARTVQKTATQESNDWARFITKQLIIDNPIASQQAKLLPIRRIIATYAALTSHQSKVQFVVVLELVSASKQPTWPRIRAQHKRIFIQAVTSVSPYENNFDSLNSYRNDQRGFGVLGRSLPRPDLCL